MEMNATTVVKKEPTPIDVWMSLFTFQPQLNQPLYLPRLDLQRLNDKFAEDYCKYFKWHFNDSHRSFLTARWNPDSQYEFSYWHRMHDGSNWGKFMLSIAKNTSRSLICTWRSADYDSEKPIPCFVMMWASRIKTALDLTVVFRSRDVIRRMIPNWYAIKLMQRDIANELNLTPGLVNDFSMRWFYKQEDMKKIKPLLRKYSPKEE
jgi:hypothetical protein